jgi:hypothetical protein
VPSGLATAEQPAAPPNGAGMDITTATEAIIDRLRRADSNEEFLETLTES